MHVALEGRKIGVMMADDNEGLCRLVADYLNAQEDIHLLGSYRDGESLLAALKNSAPDVVVLDVVMPRLDGMGVLERIREEGAGAAPGVLFLSAFGQERVTRRAGQLGADYFLLKPFDLEVLGRRIREVAEGDHEALGGVVPRPTDTTSFAEISRIMRAVGIAPNVRGYRYLRSAILRVVEKVDLMGAVTKELYPSVAAEFGTTATRVERAIRHAIESACDRGEVGVISDYFGYVIDPSRGKPTNSEFIALVADRVRMGGP